MLLEVTNDVQSVTMHLHSLTTNMMQVQASVIELQHNFQIWSLLGMLQGVLLVLVVGIILYMSNVVKRVTSIAHRLMDMNDQTRTVTTDLAKAIIAMEEFRKLKEEADEVLARLSEARKQ
jgi:hypothetical protein